MKDLIFINSHPIQYFAPMYKRMNEMGVKTACWYCTDATVQGGFDQQFGIDIKWDIPLLQGYEYKFFKNNSWKPSHSNGFFGLINLSMIQELFKIERSVIVVHGWHYFTLFWILILGKICAHTICLRCELPNNQEVLKRGWAQKVKCFGLKYILFPRINYFLYIGKQNRIFYESFGIPDEKLISCPYSVDNLRCRDAYFTLQGRIPSIKNELHIPASAKIVVFSAKYIPKKRPLDLLQAFGKLEDTNLWLIMVGEGELRPQMELLIRESNIKNVILTGFVNQSKISEYYAIGDLFVMCSGIGETWGLSVNEAMNFDLPLIISDFSGCSGDLVKQGINGYTFKTGNIDDLTSKLKFVLLDNKLTKDISSMEIVSDYSYETVARNLYVLV